ncbi:MAG: hypothetical protein H7235_03190 [Bdellovibrionaceae bacterium]|nr:hypothetical protein [Pseudobdellovibrionaceae bacterium]
MDILSTLLSQKVSTQQDKQSDFERVFWFVNLMKWVQRPRSAEEKNTKSETVYTVRIKYLLMVLNNNPSIKENFIHNIRLLLLKLSSPGQLTQAGLPESSSFIQDFTHRLQEKIIPKKQLSEDLSTLVYEIFPQEEESLYLDFIEADVLGELLGFFQPDQELIQKLKLDTLTSCYILSHEVLNHSLMIQKELDLLNNQPQALPEFRLEGLLRQKQMHQEKMITEVELFEVEAIEKNMDTLFAQMKDRGVKIQLVYLFQIQKRKINRLRTLLQFLSDEIPIALTFRYFVSQLVLETQHQKSLKSFFSENLALLTDRIVQTHSHIGEHYVTFTWSDFHKMFRNALGGGGVTGFTVIVKHMISDLKWVGFIKGLADSLNYSTSFMLIQMLGWTLATKQPSMTAPYIASALQTSTTEARKSIIALLRTQFIAVLGNLTMVFPVCFLFSWFCIYTGRPFISEHESLEMFRSTNILGPSALYAAFTGVLLFMASLIAGWFENWILVNRVDKRIKYNDRLQKYFGQNRVQRFSEFLKEKSNPLAANISLGFLLGFVPQIMKFLNIPLETRHVTLATGGFASALPAALRSGVSNMEIFNSASGILVIGFLNITVSFSIAFLLASISSKVKFRSFWRLLKWSIHFILTKPWLLLVPEKTKRSDG